MAMLEKEALLIDEKEEVEETTLIGEEEDTTLLGEEEIGANEKLHMAYPRLLRNRLLSISRPAEVCKTAIWFVLPSCIQSWIRPAPNPSKPQKLHPTAFLDGMRGLSALLVFFYHMFMVSHDLETAYDAGKHGENRELLKLPFIRFLYTGQAMVAIFFVVSGYALSYKPVRLMRSKNWKELMHTISSSVFRRAIRLFLPCICSTLLMLFVVRLGGYEWTRKIANNSTRLNYTQEIHYRRFKTLWEQLADWCHHMFMFIDTWSFGTKDTKIWHIDSHLWTIPVEFRSSLVLYVTQAGLARLRPVLRLSSVVVLIIWCVSKDRWEMILFYGGFALAELDIMRRSNSSTVLPCHGKPLHGQARRRLWNAVYILAFLIGIYLCGQPEKHGDQSLGWATLTRMIPKSTKFADRFWVGWGALLLVWATSNASFLQRIFDNAPVQYLGKISFALYLMHGLVTHTVGYGMMDFMWSITGTRVYWKKELGFCIAALVNMVCVICAGDVFWRAVDTPVVKFGKWLEEKCIVRLEW